jgi:hypothetical protein
MAKNMKYFPACYTKSVPSPPATGLRGAIPVGDILALNGRYVTDYIFEAGLRAQLSLNFWRVSVKIYLILLFSWGVRGQTIVSTGNDTPNHKSPVTFELDFSYSKNIKSRSGRIFNDIMDFFVDDVTINTMTVNRTDKKDKIIFDFNFNAYVRRSHDKLINATLRIGNLGMASLPIAKSIEEGKSGTFKIRLECEKAALENIENPKLSITLSVQND